MHNLSRILPVDENIDMNMDICIVFIYIKRYCYYKIMSDRHKYIRDNILRVLDIYFGGRCWRSVA